MEPPIYTLDPDLPYVQFWLTTTAPMLVGMDWGSFLKPSMVISHDSPASWQESINSSWNVSNRTEMYRTIWRLAMMEMHGQIWQEDFARFRCSLSSQWRASLRKIEEPVPAAEQQFMNMVAHLTGEEGFLGWDLVRASYLVRSGLFTGWVPESDAVFFLNVIAQQTQRNFRSWDDYIRSYLCGRLLWEFRSYEQDEQIEHIEAFLRGEVPSGFRSFSYFYEHYDEEQTCPLHWLAWQTELPDFPAPQSLIDIINLEEKK